MGGHWLVMALHVSVQGICNVADSLPRRNIMKFPFSIHSGSVFYPIFVNFLSVYGPVSISAALYSPLDNAVELRLMIV